MITNFKNPPEESLYDGYKRFRGFLNNCPHHGFPPLLILHTFYGGLNKENKIELDSASNAAFIEINMHDAWNLLETIHHNKETYNEWE